MSVAEKLRGWFSREVLEGADVGLTDTTPLLELGLVDSITIVKLQKFITAEFGVEIPFKMLTPENLSSIQRIADVVADLQKRK